MMQRYFVDKNKNKFVLKDTDKKHIKKVMRMKNNDLIEIVYDKKIYEAKIIDVNTGDIEIIKEIENINKSKINVTIAQGLVREQKWDFIIQKMAELGVEKIIPLQLTRSNVVIEPNKTEKKMERWYNICKEASEQSFRNYVPELTKIMTLNEIINLEYDLKIFCSTTEKENNLKKVLQSSKKYANIIIIVGPEGGLTTGEEKLMIDNGFIGVSLGTTILRTETAPLFVLSVINYENWS